MFDLENEGQGQSVEERNLRHSTANVQIHIGDFFRILFIWQHVYAKGYIHKHTLTHTHTHTQRETVVMTKRKICKAVLSKSAHAYTQTVK